MKNIELGFSPCPNDTFMFYAMLHNLVDTSFLRFKPRVHDIEILNNEAFNRRFQVKKLFFFISILWGNWISLMQEQL